MRNAPTFLSGLRPTPTCARTSCDCEATRVTCCERKRICAGSSGGSPTIHSVWSGWSGCVTCHRPGPAYSPVTTISSSGCSGVWAREISAFSAQASASKVARAPVWSGEVRKVAVRKLATLFPFIACGELFDGGENLAGVRQRHVVRGILHFDHLAEDDALAELLDAVALETIEDACAFLHRGHQPGVVAVVPGSEQPIRMLEG